MPSLCTLLISNSPGDPKRGGNAQDLENFVQFLKEMREAANAEVLKNGQERLILSIALPGVPFHGDKFLIPKLAPYSMLFVSIVAMFSTYTFALCAFVRSLIGSVIFYV